MNAISLKLSICLIAVGITLYALIEEQNRLTELRLELPALSKEVKAIQDENARLHYQLSCFENPVHLLELARKPEFGHLKYPSVDEVIVLPKGPPQ